MRSNLRKRQNIVDRTTRVCPIAQGDSFMRQVNGLLGTISGALGGPVRYGEDIQNPSRHRQCGATSGLVTLRLARTNRPAPPPGIVHSIASAEISGPSTVAPGSSAQFGIVARMTDGSTRDVTEGLSWHSTNTSVLTAGSTGVVAGSRSGEAILQVNTTLRLVQPRPDVSGTYVLTIAADCRSGSLPRELQERRYTATISQTGRNLGVALSGATFKSGSNHEFYGQIDGNNATFSVSYGYYYYDPSIIEQLPDSVLIVSGFATTSIASNSMTGTMSGYISQMTGYPGTTISSCSSTAHKFALTR